MNRWTRLRSYHAATRKKVNFNSGASIRGGEALSGKSSLLALFLYPLKDSFDNRYVRRSNGKSTYLWIILRRLYDEWKQVFFSPRGSRFPGAVSRNFKLPPSSTEDRPEGNPIRSFEFVTARASRISSWNIERKSFTSRRGARGEGVVSCRGKRYRGCGYRFTIQRSNDRIRSFSFFFFFFSLFQERWIWISTSNNLYRYVWFRSRKCENLNVSLGTWIDSKLVCTFEFVILLYYLYTYVEVIN